MDPLTEPDALVEGQVLDVWLDAMRARVAVLLEMRMALQLREGNTGLLVASDVTEVSWTAERRSTPRTAWNVVSSRPEACIGELTLRLAFVPDAELSFRARSAAYFSLHVPDLDDAPPNYGTPATAWPQDDEPLEFTDPQLDQRIPRWESHAVPVHAVFLDAIEPHER